MGHMDYLMLPNISDCWVILGNMEAPLTLLTIGAAVSTGYCKRPQVLGRMRVGRSAQD